MTLGNLKKGESQKEILFSFTSVLVVLNGLSDSEVVLYEQT